MSEPAAVPIAYERYSIALPQLALLANAIIPAVLLAVQSGANMKPQSMAAKGTNIALFAFKARPLHGRPGVFTSLTSLARHWPDTLPCACARSSCLPSS